MTIEKDYVFPVYISDKILETIKKICKENELEVFGYLVGELFIWKGQKYILINHYLYIEGAIHGNEISVIERGEKGMAYDNRPDHRDQYVEFEFSKYVLEFEKLKRKEKNERLLNVGWWHSHPDFGCFLSETDLITQEEIFYKPYHVALVVDPIRDVFNFFTLDKNNSKKRYKAISFAIIK